ncbi:MAG: response regulator [Nitrospirales bacterium]|nr:response regulator [Nitrospirales bacterium]
MNQILLVDDEPSVLEALQRQFRKQFQITTAVSGEQGLEKLTAQGPFGVVVSDCQMPMMNGIQFLSHVRSLSPDTVRIMLTGKNDLGTAMEAVNQGEIFRFLTKPCLPEIFQKALESGIRQYQLIRAEKELLEQTLTGSLKALSEVLSLFNPEAFGRASRLKRYVLELAQQMGISDVWRLEIAATLSQIGAIILPETILKKIDAGAPLTTDETKVFYQHPCTGRDILAKIPRMQEVADIIMYQHKHFDGSGTPGDGRREEDIPLGARLLKVAIDFDGFRIQDMPPSDACEKLQERTGWYDPKVLQALKVAFVREQQFKLRHISLRELQPHMVLAGGIFDTKGHLLVGKGQDLSEWMVTRLKQMGGGQSVQEPIRVIVPVECSPAACAT